MANKATAQPEPGPAHFCDTDGCAQPAPFGFTIGATLPDPWERWSCGAHYKQTETEMRKEMARRFRKPAADPVPPAPPRLL